MATQRLELPSMCKGDTGRAEACVACARERLSRSPGVHDIQILRDGTDELATLELDYDPRQVTLTDLLRDLRESGVCVRGNRAELVLSVQGMVSPKSEQTIESALSKLPGVTASASFASRTLRVEFDRSQCALPELVRKLDQLGLKIVGPATAAVESKPSGLTRLILRAREHRQLAMALVGGLMLVGAFLTHVLHGPQGLRLPLVIGAFLLCGWHTFLDTLAILRQFKFDIDVLMFAAAFGAASLGHFEEGALLLFLFALGGAGEEMAMDRARRAIAALAKLAPDTATLRDAEGHDRLVRVDDLKLNDKIVIRPFERVPADAKVLAGASAVDQSPITGESVPVEKVVGEPVFAGTINGEGLLLAGVTKLAGDSTLAKIVKMVNEAQTTKSPTQVFAEKVEKKYVPLVLLGTLVVMLMPLILRLFNQSGEWGVWLYRSMAFLTAASPCALAIGTPAAVLSGIARAAKLGVLVKGGAHLENLGRVSAVAFDKTGTLTRGRPEITDVVTFNGMPEAELLALAAAVERGSSHPLAKAIVGESDARECPKWTAEDLEQIPAKGMIGRVNGKRVMAGHLSMLEAPAGSNGNGKTAGQGDSGNGLEEARSAVARLGGQGKTTVAIAVDGRAAGVIALADRPRENAAESIDRLKRLGLKRTIMLTGDNATVAAAIAKEVHIDEFHGGLLPEDKLNLIKTLRDKYGYIAMVGDGVNDAPALATATVGIAMGGAGTDVAIETADVALMADDLAKLPDAIGLSRFSRKIIKQNLVIALGTIAVLAPLAALGYAYLGMAVLFHEGSTVVVVLNSLRLLVYKPMK